MDAELTRRYANIRAAMAEHEPGMTLMNDTLRSAIGEGAADFDTEWREQQSVAPMAVGEAPARASGAACGCRRRASAGTSM